MDHQGGCDEVMRAMLLRMHEERSAVSHTTLLTTPVR